MQRGLTVLFPAILYKGLEQFWILVSARVLEAIPHGYLGTIVVKFWESEVICRFFNCMGSRRHQSSHCLRVNCVSMTVALLSNHFGQHFSNP